MEQLGYCTCNLEILVPAIYLITCARQCFLNWQLVNSLILGILTTNNYLECLIHWLIIIDVVAVINTIICYIIIIIQGCSLSF